MKFNAVVGLAAVLSLAPNAVAWNMPNFFHGKGGPHASSVPSGARPTGDFHGGGPPGPESSGGFGGHGGHGGRPGGQGDFDHGGQSGDHHRPHPSGPVLSGGPQPTGGRPIDGPRPTGGFGGFGGGSGGPGEGGPAPSDIRRSDGPSEVPTAVPSGLPPSNDVPSGAPGGVPGPSGAPSDAYTPTGHPSVFIPSASSTGRPSQADDEEFPRVHPRQIRPFQA